MPATHIPTMNATVSPLSRRSFLAASGLVAAGTTLPLEQARGDTLPALPPLPWPYPASGLPVDDVRKLGYCLYFLEGGCGHGSAQALIDPLAALLPEPWSRLPRGLYTYGAGGVVGWGTICGALNGVLAVMDLLGVHGKLGNALMDYHCTTLLPTRALEGWIPDDARVPIPLTGTVQTIAASPLCHNSVSKWAAAAGVPVADATKRDRCAKIVGDMVAQAATLLNDYFLRAITPPAWTPPTRYAACYNCHTQPTMIPSQQGRMDCVECHSVPPSHGIWKRRGR